MDNSNFALWIYRGLTVILLSVAGYLGANVLSTVESLKTTMETVLTTLKFQQIDANKLEKRIENLELKLENYTHKDHTFYKYK
jgi:Tfp pilus assembly protein PilV